MKKILQPNELSDFSTDVNLPFFPDYLLFKKFSQIWKKKFFDSPNVWNIRHPKMDNN